MTNMFNKTKTITDSVARLVHIKNMRVEGLEAILSNGVNQLFTLEELTVAYEKLKELNAK